MKRVKKSGWETFGFLTQDFLSYKRGVMQKGVPSVLFEDNQSTIVIAKAGYSPQLRHLAKHHRIALGLVKDFLEHPDISIEHITTDLQKGDLFTKGLSPAKHSHAMELVRLYAALGIVFPTGNCYRLRFKKRK